MATTPTICGADIDFEAVAKAAYERRFPGCWEAIPPWMREHVVATTRETVEEYEHERSARGLLALSVETALGLIESAQQVIAAMPPNMAPSAPLIQFIRRCEETKEAIDRLIEAHPESATAPGDGGEVS